MKMHLMATGSRIAYAPSDAGYSGGGGMGGGPTINQPQLTPGSQTQQPDNSQGNSGGNGNNTGTQDNSSEKFDPAAFWNEPAAPATNSGSGGGTESGAGAAGDKPKDAGAEFAAQLDGLKFGDAFTPAIAEQVAEGKFDGINQAIQGQLRDSSRQAVIMSAKLMQLHGDALMTRFEKMIDEKLGGRDNSQTLEKNFEMAKDPALRPMVEKVFDQAMRLANGDRVKAVETAKMMLGYMGTTGAKDMGITTPPSNAADTFSNAGAKSLVDELLGR